MVIAKFLRFGPNDLIQMTFSLSQDGLGKFLLACLDQKMLENDLFTMRDQLGVVGLIECPFSKLTRSNFLYSWHS